MTVRQLGTATTTAPATSKPGDATIIGSSRDLALADHQHQRESFATPSMALGTAAAAGSATTIIRSDATLAAFDTTAPTTAALGDSAATGSVALAARRDHRHGMPSAASVATSVSTQAALAANLMLQRALLR